MHAGFKDGSHCLVPLEAHHPETKDGCSPAGVPVESQRSEEGESLAPRAQIGGDWDLGCSCRLSQPQSPPLAKYPGLRAFCSHLPPHDTQANTHVRFYKMPVFWIRDTTLPLL